MVKPCSDRVLLERRRIVEGEMIVFCGFELELGGIWGVKIWESGVIIIVYLRRKKKGKSVVLDDGDEVGPAGFSAHAVTEARSSGRLFFYFSPL